MSRGGVKTADVSAYLAETKGLERDYLSEVRKSEARAWWVARGASVLALAEHCDARARAAVTKSSPRKRGFRGLL